MTASESSGSLAARIGLDWADGHHDLSIRAVGSKAVERDRPSTGTPLLEVRPLELVRIEHGAVADVEPAGKEGRHPCPFHRQHAVDVHEDGVHTGGTGIRIPMESGLLEGLPLRRRLPTVSRVTDRPRGPLRIARDETTTRCVPPGKTTLHPRRAATMYQTLLLLPALCGILMGAAGGEGVAASAGGAAWDVPGGDRGWQGAPFEIRGRVLDHETDRPVEGVAVTLLDLSDERVAGAYTDAEGGFSIAGQGAGEYRLSFRHLGYAEYRSDPLAVAEHETVTVDVRLSRATYTLDPLTVIARATPHRHDATYGGLYQRIPREMAQVGRNRILVKGDWELDMGLSARDILERVFPRVWWRRGGMCLYWNGFLVSTPMVASRLQTHVDDLEAMEVYGDYLRAPMSMWGPPPTSLATTCSGVVALWALRPDLPGRGPR